MPPRDARRMYAPILEAIFKENYTRGATEVDFERSDIERVGKKLGIRLPKNPGDLLYSFRHRAQLPRSIETKAGRGRTWIIRSVGRSRYRFVSVPNRPMTPSASLATTKVPDATPGVIEMYALSDEQALLAKLRYNRLLDIFTGITCYSLQSHLRTTVRSVGQIETDETYVGIDKRGIHYVLPVQAKGGADRLSVVQIEQDIAMCAEKFPSLVCRPIGAQFMRDNVIAMFEFEEGPDGIGVASEKHYQLVAPDEVTAEDLRVYQERLSD